MDPGDLGRWPGIERPPDKDEAVKSAGDLAGDHEPSPLLVYKEVGTVQTEHTYG